MSTEPYEKGDLPRPVLKVTLSDPLRRAKAEMLTRVDTGFDGGLLIPLDGYIDLRLQDFEEPSADFIAKSAQGITVKLRSSRGIVGVRGEDFPCRVYTTPILLRPLLGMDLLNRWKVTLDGPREELTLTGQSQSHPADARVGS